MGFAYEFKNKENWYALAIATCRRDWSVDEALRFMGLQKKGDDRAKEKRKRTRTISSAEKEEILRMSQNGSDITEISEKIDRSYGTIQRLLNTNGIYKDVGKCKNSAEEKRKMLIMLHNQGLSITEIAKAMGKSEATIYANLRRLREEEKI